MFMLAACKCDLNEISKILARVELQPVQIKKVKEFLKFKISIIVVKKKYKQTDN